MGNEFPVCLCLFDIKKRRKETKLFFRNLKRKFYFTREIIIGDSGKKANIFKININKFQND